jgi:hypothetical protein
MEFTSQLLPNLLLINVGILERKTNHSMREISGWHAGFSPQSWLRSLRDQFLSTRWVVSLFSTSGYRAATVPESGHVRVIVAGGVAALNRRLQAVIPPGSIIAFVFSPV